MALTEEQSILRGGDDEQENGANIQIIKVAASTTEKINSRLQKACEAQDERNRKSWREASRIYAG